MSHAAAPLSGTLPEFATDQPLSAGAAALLDQLRQHAKPHSTGLPEITGATVVHVSAHDDLDLMLAAKTA